MYGKGSLKIGFASNRLSTSGSRSFILSLEVYLCGNDMWLAEILDFARGDLRLSCIVDESRRFAQLKFVGILSGECGAFDSSIFALADYLSPFFSHVPIHGFNA